MRQAQGVQHHVFRDLVCAGFDHQDGIFGTTHPQVQRTVFHLRGRWVDDKCTIDVANAHSADRATERNIRNHQGCRSADDRGYVHVVFLIGRQGGQDDLHVVAETFGEERPQGAVDQAVEQDG